MNLQLRTAKGNEDTLHLNSIYMLTALSISMEYSEILKAFA